VCIKTENHHESDEGIGIKFETSTYEEVNALIESSPKSKLNKYLDATYGYYTTDKQHKYVLAHYNWHKLSPDKKSKGVTEPIMNIPLINEMFNRRIQRLFEMCTKAKHIFFIFHNHQNYNYMKIDDQYYSLNDFDEFDKTCNSLFGEKFSRFNTVEITGPDMLLDIVSNI